MLSYGKCDSLGSFKQMADKSDKDKNCAGSVPTIVTCRQAFTQDTFDATFVTKTEIKRRSLVTVLQHFIRTKCPPTKQSVLEQLLAMFPVISALRHYQWRKQFPTDVLSSFWCTAVNVSMSLAFTLLASLPPVYGIYSALFPMLVYFIFGGSSHVSVHVMAVVALMVGIVVQRQMLLSQPPPSLSSSLSTPSFPLNSSNASALFTYTANTTNASTEWTTVSAKEIINGIISSYSIETAASLSLLAGLIQVAMSVLRLGRIANNIPLPFINGFLLGASCHVIINLLPTLLGLDIPYVVSKGSLPIKVVLIATSLLKVNVTSAINGLCCLVFLIIVREFVNVRFKNKLLIPIPAELIVVIVCSTISYFAQLHNRLNVNIVSTVPRGLPYPHIPNMAGATNYIVEAFIIAIISYTITLYLAKLYAAQYGYPIHANHELFAHGMSHAVGSIFSCFSGAASSPICDIQKDTRGSGPMVSLLSCCFIVAVCLFAGPLLEPLPTSTLSAVGLAALLPIFKHVTELPLLWRLNKLDIVTWSITWLAVAFVDVITGCAIGAAFALTALTLRHQTARGQTLANAKGTEIYVASSCLESGANESGILVFYFNSNLMFANAEIFKEELFSSIHKALKLNQGRSIADTVNNELTADAENVSNNAGRTSSRAQANSGDDLDENVDVAICETQNNNEAKGECGTANDPLLDKGQGQVNTKQSEIIETSADEKIEKIAVVSEQDLNQNEESSIVRGTNDELQRVKQKIGINVSVGVLHTVVIDCSAISFIDIVGLKMLSEVSDLVEGQGQRLVLAQCTPGLLRQLKAAEVSGIKFVTYPTVHDAVIFEKYLQFA